MNEGNFPLLGARATGDNGTGAWVKGILGERGDRVDMTRDLNYPQDDPLRFYLIYLQTDL